MKTLEKLICAGMTAFALACGDGNGSSSSSGSTPGCTSHNDCRGDRMCVEGECKDYEQACVADSSYACDDSSRFNGVYEVIKSNCPTTFDTHIYNLLAFKTPVDCHTIYVRGFNNNDNGGCLYSTPRVTLNQTRNSFTVVGDLDIPDENSPLEFVKCEDDSLVNWLWKNRQCSAIVEKRNNMSYSDELFAYCSI